MKRSIKKRYASLLIVMALLFGVIATFTGCSREDSTKAVYQFNIKVKDQTPEFYINDYGNVFSEDQKNEIEKRAMDLNEKYNGIQLVITTLDSLEGYSIEKYATAMYNKFGIGKKDMGVLILFSSGDRQVRIEIGRGMEAYMTDANAGALLDDYAMEYLKNNQLAEGLINLQKAVITFIEDKVPVDWDSDSESTRLTETTSDNTQVEDEGSNAVQTTNAENIESTTEKSDYSLPLIFWLIVIVATCGNSIGVFFSFRKENRKLKKANEDIAIENSLRMERYERSIRNLEREAWDKKAEYQKRCEEYERNLKASAHQIKELQRIIAKMQETHARAIALHPQLENEIIEMVENEFKDEAKTVDDIIQKALTKSTDKDNVAVFGEAIEKYNSTSLEAKKYVKGDVETLNKRYEQSCELLREFQRVQKEKADKKAAKDAYDNMMRIANGVKGNRSNYEKLVKANNLYLGLSKAQQRFFPDDNWLKEFYREFGVAERDHGNYEKAKETEKAVKGIVDSVGTPDEHDIDKLKRAIRMYNSLSSSERVYFDQGVYENARRKLSKAEEDHEERERRRRRRDDDDHFGGGFYGGSGSSGGSIGGSGGISNGAGASRGF